MSETASAEPLVLLFDVDGTLVRTGGAGRRALRRAFEALHGSAEGALAVDVRGNTDPRIFGEALSRLGIEPSHAAVSAVLDAYLEALADEVAASDAYEVLPAVPELLEACASRPRTALGLGTGNVARGADIKLARGGLARHFAFGGYGCDSGDRPTLVRRGAERGASRLGEPLEACRVVVLGDTPRDVDAARAIGAEVVAVATGGHALDELEAHSPTLAVATLADPRVAELLGVSAFLR